VKEHASAVPTEGNGGRARSTCRTCGRNTCVYRIDGKLIVTEAERIPVVPDDRGPRAVVQARRLHSEVCARYVEDDAREKLRLEKAEWARQQGKRGARTRGM
jgi:hypothetical protein